MNLYYSMIQLNVNLLTDLGKVLLHPSFGGLPQWAVVGDTFPVGCAFDESIVHHKVASANLKMLGLRPYVVVGFLFEDLTRFSSSLIYSTSKKIQTTATLYATRSMGSTQKGAD